MGTPPIEMANLGMADSLILMVMALVVFGPRRLPQIGRQIGKLMYEFRKASNDFKFQMEEELRTSEEADRRKKEEERLKALTLAAPPQIGLTDGASQVSETRPGAPGSEATPEATGLGEAVEEGIPRIMPPSSGEQVAAARRHSVAIAVEPEPAATAEAPTAVIVEEHAAEDTAADPEQAAHHG
jgi:sec-independent protein translocase protein TatB